MAAQQSVGFRSSTPGTAQLIIDIVAIGYCSQGRMGFAEVTAPPPHRAQQRWSAETPSPALSSVFCRRSAIWLKRPACLQLVYENELASLHQRADGSKSQLQGQRAGKRGTTITRVEADGASTQERHRTASADAFVLSSSSHR